LDMETSLSESSCSTATDAAPGGKGYKTLPLCRIF
jgi:hypothetical protein